MIKCFDTNGCRRLKIICYSCEQKHWPLACNHCEPCKDRPGAMWQTLSSTFARLHFSSARCHAWLRIYEPKVVQSMVMLSLARHSIACEHKTNASMGMGECCKKCGCHVTPTFQTPGAQRLLLTFSWHRGRMLQSDCNVGSTLHATVAELDSEC